MQTRWVRLALGFFHRFAGGGSRNLCKGFFLLFRRITAYRKAPWTVVSAKCYLVNAAAVTSVESLVGGDSLGEVTSSETDTVTSTGLHQNIICRVTFKNTETLATTTQDFYFGFGGQNDSYAGANLGGHGIDGTRTVPAHAFGA
ncbi:MAG: hypothetical protein R3B54_07300 [Bdellovibrionota bacterium]